MAGAGYDLFSPISSLPVCWGEVGTEGCAKADAEPGSPRTFLGLTAGSGVGDGVVCANLNNPQGAYTTGSGLVGLGGILLPWELS